MKLPAGHADVVGVRVRRIPLRRQADAPALVRINRGGHVVEILAFGIHELAQPAGIVDLPHRVEVFVEVGRLEHHVLEAAGLDGLEQLVGILQRAKHRRHGRGDVLAVLEHLDAVPRVAGSIGGHEDRLDPVVFDQFLERGIGLRAPGSLGQPGTAIGNQVADRHHLDVRVVLEAERGAELADAVADQPHANLAVGDRLPAFGGIRGGGRLLESLNHLLLGPGRRRREPGPRSPDPRACRNERRVSELRGRCFSDAARASEPGWWLSLFIAWRSMSARCHPASSRNSQPSLQRA